MGTLCDALRERGFAPESDEALARHLESCRDCGQAAAGTRLLITTAAEPPSRVLTGFAARTRAQLAHRQSRTLQLAPIRAAVLAGALAAAGAGGVLFGLDLLFPRGAAAGQLGAIETAQVEALADELFPDEELEFEGAAGETAGWNAELLSFAGEAFDDLDEDELVRLELLLEEG
ncbi:MAG: hypothetical protein ACK4N5_25125 [Myxococcales bacterium]